MKVVLFFLGLATMYLAAESKMSPPKIQLYSRNPGQYGMDNTLICRVTGFHPPNIDIKLTKNDQEIEGSVQTDLAFEKDWSFHLTKYVTFKPQFGETYNCKVTHGTAPPKSIVWEPNM